jgi:hypothetical protein
VVQVEAAEVEQPAQVTHRVQTEEMVEPQVVEVVAVEPVQTQEMEEMEEMVVEEK